MSKELREEYNKYTIYDIENDKYLSYVEWLEQQNTELKKQLDSVVNDKLNMKIDLTNGIKLNFEGIDKSIELVKKTDLEELKKEVERLRE